MSSWANLKSVPLKKKEPTIQSFYTSSEDYATSALDFLYSFVYTQRSAEPFYIYDNHGHIQPLLKSSPILHYLKEKPASTPLSVQQIAPVVKTLNLASLKRSVASIFQYNPETSYKIDTFLTNFGLLRQIQSYDVGVVLDLSGCVPSVVSGLKTIQKRTGKKTLKVFVMTDDLTLLKEFATKGDPSWTYVSMMQTKMPQDKDYLLTKTLAELKLMQQTDYLVLRFGSPLGKLLYLTSQKITTESQVVSVDGLGWKAL
jgi:hypothetical protein